MRRNSAGFIHRLAAGLPSALVVGTVAFSAAMAQSHPEFKDMALVGSHALQARSAYQPTHPQPRRPLDRLHRPSRRHQGGAQARQSADRSAEFNGTSILDVTDPRASQISGPPSRRRGPGGTGRGADGARVRRQDAAEGRSRRRLHAAHVRQLRPRDLGHDRSRQAEARHEVVGGLKGTHKNWWECDTGIAYLVSGVPGWRVRPHDRGLRPLRPGASPSSIRDFGLPGQQPGAAGRAPTRLHGPISTGPKGNRIYFAYGTNEGGILQIVDREKLLNGPKEPTEENLLYPQVGRLDMSPLDGRAHHLPGARHADRRVRQGQGRQGARLRRRHQRVAQERVPGAAPVRVDSST